MESSDCTSSPFLVTDFIVQKFCTIELRVVGRDEQGVGKGFGKRCVKGGKGVVEVWWEGVP